MCGDVKTRPRSVPSTGPCAKARETRQSPAVESASTRQASRAGNLRGDAWREMKLTSGKRTLLRERPELLKRSDKVNPLSRDRSARKNGACLQASPAAGPLKITRYVM